MVVSVALISWTQSLGNYSTGMLTGAVLCSRRALMKNVFANNTLKVYLPLHSSLRYLPPSRYTRRCTKSLGEDTDFALFIQKDHVNNLLRLFRQGLEVP